MFAGLLYLLKLFLDGLLADLSKYEHDLNIRFSKFLKHPSQVGINHKATEVRNFSLLALYSFQRFDG
jgi:hypothetical protein